ncbi:MAG TPA: TetR/AcrR family transcriptional regulator [Baekduia sp.]|nr:TetR/AcrR family transcriptional regulator [Baekduia sp.]
MSPTVPSTRRAQIVEAARHLLEEHGPGALSMRNVAAAIGIRAPSLYEHVTDKRALESAIIAAGLEEQGVALTEAVAETRDGDDALMALSMAWRRWALAHPHVYRLIYVRDLDRSDPAVAAAEQAAGAPLRALCGGDVSAARVIWSFAHGMVSLELSERFPPGTDVDELWVRGLGALRGLLPPR